jgi:hypothetical protein
VRYTLANTNGDGDGKCDRYSDSNGHCQRHANRYGYGHSNSQHNALRDSICYEYLDAQTDAYTAVRADAETSSYTCATTIAGKAETPWPIVNG